jgi:hypothetical protein
VTHHARESRTQDTLGISEQTAFLRANSRFRIAGARMQSSKQHEAEREAMQILYSIISTSHQEFEESALNCHLACENTHSDYEPTVA